jgi:transcriptional regulator with XRE-family HTH domain
MEFILNITDKINSIINEKGMTRKHFIKELLLLNPILKTTKETPSSSTIYGYLNGSREVKTELIPYIAKVLDVGISELFEDNKKDRVKILQNILENPSQEEQKLLENYFKFEEKLNNQKLQNDTNYHLYNYILQMLPYASEKFLYTLIDLLESYKDSTKRAQEDIKNLDF